MELKFLRSLRTPSSERFILQSTEDTEGHDAAALDIHYLTDGSVFGTLVILDQALLGEGATEQLLKFIDESLLPMVSLDEKTLSFTVIKGELVGEFENES